MSNYKNGLIYLITDNTNDNKYIGSTKQKLKDRITNHKCDYRNYLLGKRNKVMSFDIIKNGDYKYEVLEYYPCESRRELEKCEQKWLDKIDCINAKRSFMTTENRREMNRVCDSKRKRIGDPDHLKYLKQLRDYKSSWGGDQRTQNNLLLINIH